MAKKIRVKVFDDLHQSLADAGAYEQGKPVNLRTKEIPPPPRPLKPAEIRRIRLALNASQALFARFLNVSANTVESWEQGTGPSRPQVAHHRQETPPSRPFRVSAPEQVYAAPCLDIVWQWG